MEAKIPKVVVRNRKSQEDPTTVETILTTRLPKGWSYKRNILRPLGFLWEWDSDGWFLFGPDGVKAAHITNGRNIQVWGQDNIESLKGFAEFLSTALNCPIVIDPAE